MPKVEVFADRFRGK